MGGSDEEIVELSPERKERAGVKANAKKESWDDADRLKLVSYIIDLVQWPDFKINQAKFFGEVWFVAIPS